MGTVQSSNLLNQAVTAVRPLAPEKWSFPFFVAAGQKQAKMNVIRIIEALIIAAIVAVSTNLVTVSVMKAEMRGIMDKQAEIKQQLNKIHDDIYKPVFSRQGAR